MKIHYSILIVLLSIALGGCGTPALGGQTEMPVTLPTQGVETQMPVPSLTGIPAGMEKMVESARQDLAKRLAAPASEITLVEARPVTWGNSSLGCPEPGMAYAEMMTPGYLLILNSGGTQVEYHAGSDQAPFYCKNPQAPSQYDPSSN